MSEAISNISGLRANARVLGIQGKDLLSSMLDQAADRIEDLEHEIAETIKAQAEDIERLKEDVEYLSNNLDTSCIVNGELRAEIAKLKQERDEAVVRKNGSFSDEVLSRVLIPANCGVSGHFRFQQNGGYCMMCQKEKRNITAALNVAAAERALKSEPTEGK